MFQLGVAGCSDDADGSPPVDGGTPIADGELEWSQAFDAESVGWFLCLWGPTADSLYAIGGAPDEGLIMHFDGQSWEALELGVQVPLLNWAHGFGDDDITVVGDGGTVIHWDGNTWEVQSTPTEENLWGVWGASPDDLWAVGGAGREEGQETILHYDGSDWSEVDSPELMRANVYAFFKVWGTSADNIYIVGQNGVVLHYDGTEWTEEFAGVSDDLISLWGTGSDRIIAVGGRGSAVATVWDGNEWSPLDISRTPGLNGVWMAADGTAHAVGESGAAVTIDVDAGSFSSYFVPVPTTAPLDFHSVYSPDGKFIVGVGGNLLAPRETGPYQGIAYQATIPD